MFNLGFFELMSQAEIRFLQENVSSKGKSVCKSIIVHDHLVREKTYPGNVMTCSCITCTDWGRIRWKLEGAHKAGVECGIVVGQVLFFSSVH